MIAYRVGVMTRGAIDLLKDVDDVGLEEIVEATQISIRL